MSLLNLANADRSAGLNTYGNLSRAQFGRDQTNRQIRHADQQRDAGNASGALSTGLSVGLATGNPLIGVAAGAGVLLLGSLF